MIAVFGATYTAINAFRNHYNSIISEHAKQAPEKVSKIQELRGVADGEDAQIYADQIKTAQRLWHWFSLLPIGLFLIFAFGMSYWLFNHWDQIAGKFDSDICKMLTECNAVLNLIALFGALFSYFWARQANKHLTKKYLLAAQNATKPSSLS